MVSLEDLDGGRLCAALDRQHARDLFDVMQPYEHEGMTSEPVTLEALPAIRDRPSRATAGQADALAAGLETGG